MVAALFLGLEDELDLAHVGHELRIWQPNQGAPVRLRHSFVSLLIAEGRTVIDVAGQAGHSPETCLRYYAHLFAEFDPPVRVSAEELIRKARLDAGGRSVDAGGDAAEAA